MLTDMMLGGNNEKHKQIVRDLDGILPGEINRRKFLRKSVTTATSGAFAGYLGSSSVFAEQDGGQINRDIIWRAAWKNEPSYVVPHVAARQGIWSDLNISAPSVKRGFGSGDTSKRVGTKGKATFGMSAAPAQVTGKASGLNFSAYGTAKARGMYVLAYNKSKMPNGIEDLPSGSTIAVPEGNKTLHWAVFERNVPGIQDKQYTAKEMGPGASRPRFLEGNLPATFTLLHHWAKVEERADFEVGAIPLYNYFPMYGYLIIADNNFLNKNEANTEYAVRVLTGYSRAMKWTMLNPEKALQMLTDEINPQLKTWDENVLTGAFKAGVIAPNTTEGIKNNGFGYLDREIGQRTLDAVSENLDVDNPPEFEDLYNFDLYYQAELATMSNDEWSQVEEYASFYLDTFGFK
jgi:ABC-type nitrate/sulfonate/bicarbonate transport system substrate-binding protein